MQFEWDPQKAELNARKHGVSFAEAQTVFGDPLAQVLADPDHSQNEDRSLLLGMSSQARLLLVSFVDRGQAIRIISARALTRAEREDYERE